MHQEDTWQPPFQTQGLGLVGASYGDPDWMVQQLSLMQDLNKPWGVGLVMFTVAKRFELLHLALEFGPQVVALSFGDARPFIEPIHQANAKVIVQVHDVDQALYALDAGADALIVQGAEAGGTACADPPCLCSRQFAMPWARA